MGRGRGRSNGFGSRADIANAVAGAGACATFGGQLRRGIAAPNRSVAPAGNSVKRRRRGAKRRRVAKQTTGPAKSAGAPLSSRGEKPIVREGQYSLPAILDWDKVSAPFMVSGRFFVGKPRNDSSKKKIATMKIFQRLAKIIALGFALVLLLQPNAYAYIDPGTGAFVLQFLLAGFFGAAFAIKLYWRNLKKFVKTKFARAPLTGEPRE